MAFVTPKSEPVPEPFDQQKEVQAQTALLKSINGKLGFIVFVIVLAGIIQFFAFLIS